MTTETPFLKLEKPDIEGSQDVWGNILNTGLDKIDVGVHSNYSTAGAALYRGRPLIEPDVETEEQKRTASQILLYADTVTVPNDRPGAIVDAKWVRALINAVLPIGTILLWNGSTFGSIPAGWALCDGRTQDGQVTPNLTGRFIMQATVDAGGSGFYPGYAGGVTAFNIDVRSEAVALTYAQMPVHKHVLNDPSHVHDNDMLAAPGYGLYPNASGGSYTGIRTTGGDGIDTDPAYTGLTMKDAGSGTTHDHRVQVINKPWNEFYPPFIALCYIMKVKNV